MARAVLKWPANSTIAILERRQPLLFTQLRLIFGQHRAAQIMIGCIHGKRR